MHIDLVWDESKKFPVADNKEDITSIKVWNCKYKNFDALSEFITLEEIAILRYPNTSLDIFLSMPKLRHLEITHLPKITDFSALPKLDNLESLSFSTLPSWDFSGKRLQIPSLEIFSQMKALKHLELIGARFPDESLVLLEKSKTLKTLIGTQYSETEKERFYQVTGCIKSRLPKFTLFK
jgi:hypothetical protein